MLNPPSPWANPVLQVYHGTTEAYANVIQTSGIQVLLGTKNTDFGPGFYTTTLQQQARNWAWALSEQDPRQSRRSAHRHRSGSAGQA